MAVQWLVHFETHPVGKHLFLTLLIMLCYACQQESSIVALWEVVLCSWLRQMRTSTEKHWMMVGTIMEDLGEGLQALKDIETPQEDQQCQLTWTPMRSQRLSHQLKSIYGLVWDPQHMCSRGLLCLASVGEDMLNPVETWCPREEECW